MWQGCIFWNVGIIHSKGFYAVSINPVLFTRNGLTKVIESNIFPRRCILESNTRSCGCKNVLLKHLARMCLFTIDTITLFLYLLITSMPSQLRCILLADEVYQDWNVSISFHLMAIKIRFTPTCFVIFLIFGLAAVIGFSSSRWSDELPESPKLSLWLHPIRGFVLGRKGFSFWHRAAT